MSDNRYLGIDVGSITVKAVLLDAAGNTLYSSYKRHGAATREMLLSILEDLEKHFPGIAVHGAVTGSAALDLPRALGLTFIQEVIASSRSISKLAPQTDVAIELGGEDAKILYFGRSIDLRMNEACAGGTGAFIDQMATLLHTDTSGLNTLASHAKAIHPIASRCGVFAKTDMVSLLNEGVSREDLAISVLQAVVEQTISGLACGQPIRGNVAFLGGPLHFLPELVRRFAETLKLTPEQTLTFPDGQFMVAKGAALSASAEKESIPVSVLIGRLAAYRGEAKNKNSLPCLFKNEEEYASFRASHGLDRLPEADLASASGDLYLGVDLGSTTVKSVLIDSAGRVLAKSYNRNDGDPLKNLLPFLIDLLGRIPGTAHLRGVGTTGYGANLARAALAAQVSEVETVAHLKAACSLHPDTTYVIDIGGQDMKCMQVDEGAVADVRLNEACSSGCGAFLQTFATSLGMSMEKFVQTALFAKHPVDLGSRCTVFMNSKVKQAQKEGRSVDDIAAGLCYSVIRNALYKVLRLRSPKDLGEHMLVQGGSFLNDALLKVMENMLGREVHRPNLSGHMGAYGIALLAMQKKDSYEPSTLTAASLKNLSVTTKALRCKGCGNHCHLTINTFSNGQRLVSGNRCDRGARTDTQSREQLPSIYTWKEEHLFNYTPLPPDRAPRGRLGIPRVLNIYERYPFWFTLFTELGFRVEVSPFSSKQIFDMGISSMPSQSVCYPAKLAHGHISWLISQGVPQIFFPCIPRERIEYKNSVDCYSCPVACGYPEVVRLNNEDIRTSGCRMHTPFVNPFDDKSLTRQLSDEFGISRSEIRRAILKAHAAQDAYRTALHEEGRRIVNLLHEKHGIGVVICGRPYHVDPLINHGIPKLITSLGAAVLSEDSVAWMAGSEDIDLRIVDQWSFPARLYRAARVVTEHEELELVQLTSFGCGVDAISSDQVAELLHSANKMHTLLKIDEGPSLGAARIRIRSLLATVEDRRERQRRKGVKQRGEVPKSPVFTKEMRTTRTIIVPQMAPIHFALAENMFRGAGYNCYVLPTVSAKDIETGLKYVNNDSCYPSQVVIGQLINALQSGAVDPKNCALMLSQTCGPCRATNYPALLRKALHEAGFDDVPSLILRAQTGTSQPGFTMTSALLHNLIVAVTYGDMLQRLTNHTRTYEKTSGDTDELQKKWIDLLGADFAANRKRDFADDMQAMVRDFLTIPMDMVPRPRVGIVGEILLCYHPDANRHMADVTRHEGGEPVISDIVDFLLYCFSDPVYQWQHLGGKALPAFFGWYVIQKVEHMRNAARKALAGTRFPPLGRFRDLVHNAGRLISRGFQAGEGWLLSAELLRFISEGITNALCLQPFGCLPNHIVGRGVFKSLKQLYPNVNLMAVDYEGGSSEANLLNRVKLFMTMAQAPDRKSF